MSANKLLISLLIIFFLGGGTITMGYAETTELSKEQLEAYEVLVRNYVKKIKGWEPEEYQIKYGRTLPDAPLATFDAIRYDALAEIYKMQKPKLGFHPTGELRVCIQTKEMRAFSDFEEFQRIREKVLQNETK